MSRALELTGCQFGRLRVLERVTGTEKTRWNCLCECGNTKVIPTASLKNGTKSCGCLQKESARVSGAITKTHGLSGTPIHNVWRSMRSRCTIPTHQAYNNYGGRGITVCDRWLKFENFLEDMGVPEPGMTLDREKNELGYYKENCRWVDMKTQSRNKRTNVLIEFNGESKTLSEWSEITGVEYHALWNRLHISKWSVEKTLTERC